MATWTGFEPVTLALTERRSKPTELPSLIYTAYLYLKVFVLMSVK